MRSIDKQQALLELGELMSNGQNPTVTEAMVQALQEREHLASTGIGEEIAIPHGKLDVVGELLVGVARSQKGVAFESVDGKPARLFFVILAPENFTDIHLRALARISRLCKVPSFRQGLLMAKDAKDMYNVLCYEDAKLREF
jgi:PTS system nitrogen regulatory IIA component